MPPTKLTLVSVTPEAEMLLAAEILSALDTSLHDVTKLMHTQLAMLEKLKCAITTAEMNYARLIP